MYDAHPYPSPVAGDALIRDVANLVEFLFPSSTFAGKCVLDAGCGSGHRLLGMAKRFPEGSFLGIDLAAGPLRVAKELAAKHQVRNVEFRQGDLLELEGSETFDLIVSTGVIHHLASPEKGLSNLCRRLNPDGHVILWLYHPYGEFDRLLRRDLVQVFWDGERMSHGEGLDLMKELGASLAPDRYAGEFAGRDSKVVDQTSVDVDGYLNPIVNTYTFGSALDLLGRCGLDWGALHSISLGAKTRLVDLEHRSPGAIAVFCLRPEDMFSSEGICERFRALDCRLKLRAIELATKPNGFCVVAGKDDSSRVLDPRIQGNVVRLRA